MIMIEFLLVGVVVNFILLVGLVYISSNEFKKLDDRHREAQVRFMKLEVRCFELFQKVKKVKK